VGGAGADDVEGNLGADTVRGGKGVDDLWGNAQDDVLFTQDGVSDSTIDGGGDPDDCFHDSAEAGTVTSCTATTSMVACSYDFPLFVATYDSGQARAELYELDYTGQRDSVGPIVVNGNEATGVAGLAVDPTDCLLWVVAVGAGGAQKLVTIDPAAEPGGDGDYDTTVIGDIDGDDLVSIAFTAAGLLAGLEDDREIWRISKVNGSDLLSHGLVGRGSDGLYMAYDATDAGSLLVSSSGSGNGYDVDAFDSTLDRHRPLENHIDWDDGAVPFTVTQFRSAGEIIDLDTSADGTGDYPMWQRDRRNWDGRTASAQEWTGPVGNECSPQCLADIDHPAVAITVPHFNP
jgi:hypothetical protein